MADSNRGTPDRVSLLAAIADRPSAFDFHIVLRRLECFFRDRPRWGEAVRPSDEPIRLGQEPSLAFAHSTVAAFKQPADGRPGRLLVRFFGLLGPNGPLPLHLTEYARERLRHFGDPTLAAFLDVFHHRMLSLFHRAWAMGQPTVAHDRAKTNPFHRYVGALAGIGMRSLQNRDLIPDAAKLQYAGRLANPTRNAEGLKAVLGEYFEHPITIEEFVGEWLDLPEGARSRLGHSPEVSTLGRSLVLGRRTWSCTHKFRVVVGPIRRSEFQALLPGTRRLERLSALVRAYVGDELDWDVRLVLAEDASKQVELGMGDRLGWYTRLGKATGTTRREDVIVHPATHRTRRLARYAS